MPMARDYPGLKGRLMLQKSTICQVSADSISYPSLWKALFDKIAWKIQKISF